VRRDDVLSILPGTLPPRALADWLERSDAAVVMKLGRTFAAVRDSIHEAGATDRAIYVERASSDRERVEPIADVAGSVPYMSLVLIPGEDAPTPRRGTGARRSELLVVGLGPGDPVWLTPEARAALAGADAVVGYETYLARVPTRPGQRRLGSDNRYELDRAKQALELALAGDSVAVVSSGDPGVFAMASAVFEVIEAGGERYASVDVRVIPGISAMQAAASRVGAPLGHDFCAISLSDIRKPWDAIAARLEAAGGADLVVALYNPASTARREQLERARELLLSHRAAETPTVVARAVGAEDESVSITTLGKLDVGDVDMRTLVIIGSSTTRVFGSGDRAWVYTPRSYP
jgi:precorrin-2 C20-methyltransferase / precorrin-3B C17-methyltransferase